MNLCTYYVLVWFMVDNGLEKKGKVLCLGEGVRGCEGKWFVGIWEKREENYVLVGLGMLRDDCLWKNYLNGC